MHSRIFHQHPSIVTVALGITFIAITNDLLPSRMGVQAWTYNYTTDPPLTWESARSYCREHFTDIVAIQNKAEIAYLNKELPRNRGYYWIGIRKVEGKWTWVGTKKVLTPEAENWATGEPNDLGDGQDCVEIYIKRELDMAKWNDENCMKKKGAICYTASCSKESCSQFGECVETIGDFTCSCHLGFEGPRCERAVVCGPVQSPEQGSVDCLHTFGENAYNSSCQVRCNAGFQLQRAAQLLCLATGQWDQQTPSCQAVKCPAVSGAPGGGSMNCSHPFAPHSFTSTCEFRCDEGFLLQGAQRTECDTTGQWTQPTPTCTVVTCDPLVPSGVDATCENPLGASSYNSTCSFSCKTGHTLTGPLRLTCLASGTWSAVAPVCEVVRCGQLNATLNGKLRCEDPLKKFSYSSTCWLDCDSGFILKGSNSTFCSARGQWSHALPICQAIECPAVSDAPTGGGMNCSHPIAPHSFNSSCEFKCDDGFLLQGARRIDCSHTGQWTPKAPTCKAVVCGPVRSPEQGSVDCLHTFGENTYNSSCQVRCNAGFQLQGAAQLLCLATGQWDQQTPSCQAVECPAVSGAPSGDVNCSHPIAPYSFTSTCEFRCDEGFLLQGFPRTECNATGQWNHPAPTCTVRERSLGAAMIMYTAVGAASALGLLGLIGLVLLARRLAKKASSSKDDMLWNTGINPVFEDR
ncbi:P-selectin [Sardina pilchardus]|uniref:P-selectin n=1 Tax=Sardina pilchardus TaxID=27697 RepID=UPI002E0DC4E5